MQTSLYKDFQWWFDLGGTVYFVSDTHFGDTDCYKLRFPGRFNCGLSDEEVTKQLDAEQIKRINSKCGQYDTLVHLGDVGDIECIKKLKAGHKILILGNHDRGVSYYERKVEELDTYVIGCYDCRRKKTVHVLDETSYCPQCKKETRSIFLGFDKIDNKLFDRVYSGTLQIAPNILLSHERADYKYCLDLHGHDHTCSEEHQSLNMILEANNYEPVCIKTIYKSGILKTIVDIHRETIDEANKKYGK